MEIISDEELRQIAHDLHEYGCAYRDHVEGCGYYYEEGDIQDPELWKRPTHAIQLELTKELLTKITQQEFKEIKEAIEYLKNNKPFFDQYKDMQRELKNFKRKAYK